MSHFSVLVIHDDEQSIEDLLAPYDESLKVEPYIAFTKQEGIEFIKKQYPRKKFKSDEERWRFLAKDYDTDAEGNFLSVHNPNAKWDWWVEGGRWDGYLRVGNSRVNTARIKDVNFSIDQREYDKAIQFWDVAVEHKPIPTGFSKKNFVTLWKSQYYLDTFGDKETFAKQSAQFATQAVVMPGGDWYELGEVGWFGMGSETKEDRLDWYDNYYNRYIGHLDSDLWLTIIDCHI